MLALENILTVAQAPLVDGIGELWYKAHTNYTVEHTSELWFRNGEIDWFEQDE